MDGEASSWKSVLGGVPHGSVLGPMLFLVYIDDLEEGVTGNILKFADDIKLFRKTKEIGDKQKIQGDSSRKVPVLAHFTIHMVEIIQLYTDQPHTWLGFRHHPSSSVFQPYVWLDTISNSLHF